MLYRQTFVVEGTGDFPFDMLRYDQCWPATESESPLMDNARVTHSEEYFRNPRRITLKRTVNYKHTDMPTIGRWKSFGWTVLENTIETYKI